MATWDDVRRLALALPDVEEKPSYGGAASWSIKGKAIVWERPLRGKELAELGAEAVDWVVLGVRVADVGVKQALVAEDPDIYFTTAHFDGYPAVLVRLDRIGVDELEELVVEAWLDRAPKRLARAYRDADAD